MRSYSGDVLPLKQKFESTFSYLTRFLNKFAQQAQFLKLTEGHTLTVQKKVYKDDHQGTDSVFRSLIRDSEPTYRMSDSSSVTVLSKGGGLRFLGLRNGFFKATDVRILAFYHVLPEPSEITKWDFRVKG